MPPPGLTLTATPISGGTAPFTYQWTVKSRIFISSYVSNDPAFGTPLNVAQVAISSGATLQTVSIVSPVPGQVVTGLLCCKVTDSKGFVTYGYYFVWLMTTPP